MRVEILEGETVIGSAILVHLDPPMGVASGPFTPSAQYDRIRHANTVNGAYIDDFGKSLRVRADKGGELEGAIAIEDWAEALGTRELTIFFADGNDYRALFSDHEEYKRLLSEQHLASAFHPKRTLPSRTSADMR